MKQKLTLVTLTTILMAGSLAMMPGCDSGKNQVNALKNQANQQAGNIQEQANQRADALKEQANDKAAALKQQASNLNDSASKRAEQIKDQGKEQANQIKQNADQKTEAMDNSQQNQKQSSEKVASSQLGHDQIRNYQQSLKQMGFLSGNADGIMGPKTHQAISKFQAEKKLAVNGKFDQETQQMLSQNAGQAGK